MFALKRFDGKYAAWPGLPNSYTTVLEEIQVFKTREEAERSRCVESERIVDLNNVFGRGA